jgi:tRNA threonylcarbamoyladenosine biosynthesis protein TsaB
MPLILNIDTATEFASICLSKGNNILCFKENKEQKNHASFLQPAIQQIMLEAGYTLNKVDAIAITNGPGSYTGLRVGLASAKGLCFALNKPLVTLNTLQVIANSVIRNWELGISKDEVALSSKFQIPNSKFQICPMIDARRMEVFTALYDNKLNEVLTTQAMILDEHSFKNQLEEYNIIFCGNGAAKFQSLINNSNAQFNTVQYSAKDMVQLSLDKFNNKSFADIAYSSPIYGKEFYTTTPKKLLTNE